MSKSKLFTFLLIFLSFSAIFSFYNFDSASAQSVVWTYNAGTNTATASGSGSTNFAALVAADTAGGWGKFTADASGTQITLGGKIIIGDGTNATAFADTLKQVIWLAGLTSGNLQDLILVKNASSFVLGTLNDATNYDTKNGCDFVYLGTSYNNYLLRGENTALIQIYSSSFATTSNQAIRGLIRMGTTSCRLWNSVLSGDVQVFRGTGSVYNLQLHSPYYGFNLDSSSSTMTLNNILILNALRGLQQSYAVTVTNLKMRNCGVVMYISTTTSGNSYLVNPDVDTWAFTFQDATSTMKVYRQYTFDLNVLNGEITDFVQNANVTLYKDGSKIYSGLTNSSGMIPTQTLTYGYYQQATGNNIQNATSPYYLVITHPDWKTYVSRFYITQPLRLTVSMQEPTYTGYTEVQKSDYTTIILFVISLILCIIGLVLTVPLLPLISLTISVINIIFLSEPSLFNILLIVLNVTFTLIALVRAKTKNN